jgi:hypothetical protein
VSRHGTRHAYNQGCRCQACTAANTTYKRQWKARHDGVPPDVTHGIPSTYINYDCRCRPCTDAQNARVRQWYADNAGMPIRTHGPSGYRRGCRCEPCRTANRVYKRAWQQRRRAEAAR